MEGHGRNRAVMRRAVIASPFVTDNVYLLLDKCFTRTELKLWERLGIHQHVHGKWRIAELAAPKKLVVQRTT